MVSGKIVKKILEINILYLTRSMLSGEHLSLIEMVGNVKCVVLRKIYKRITFCDGRNFQNSVIK